MPEYLSPGVYVEEVDTGSKPIEGVGTAMAAFVGYAPAGEFNKPQLITNWSQFCEAYGDITGSPWLKGGYLAHAVYGYFNNGGTRCYVVRVARPEDLSNGKQLPAQTARGALGPIQVRAIAAGAAGNEVKVEVQKAGDEPVGEKFRLIITRGDEREVFESGPRNQPLNLGNVKTAVKSKIIEILEVAEGTLEESSIQLAGGQNAQAPAKLDIKPNDFIGDEARRRGMNGFAVVDDVTMLCVPDLMYGLYQRDPLAPVIRKAGKAFVRTCPKCKSELDPKVEDANGNSVPKTYASVEAAEAAGSVEKCPACGAVGQERLDKEALDARKESLIAWQMAMLNHCERMHDRVAILDSPPGMNPMEIKQYRMVDANFDSKFGTLYYPWIQVHDPLTKAPTYVPPSGHMAGIWARNDQERGVHKAPANEVVRGAVNLEYKITKGEQDTLNPEGVNCIREFPGRGRRVWGARTLSSDPSWRYLNIRRLFNYLEKSIEKGTQWVVFEPNDYDLWQRVRRNISAFLRVQYQAGMLFGATAEDAFFVKCDEETNPQESIELGRLITEIGVRPVYPAEFVIFRIGQWSGGSSVGE